MRPLFILIFGFLIAACTLQQSRPDIEKCSGSSGSEYEQIAACTRAIASGQLSKENLAITFYNSG